MASGKKMEEWQVNYVEENHKEQTPEEMAKAVTLSTNKIYVLCKAKGWVYKSKPRPERKPHVPLVKSDIIKKISVAYVPDKQKEPIKRPPPVYSNSTPFGIAKQLHR